MSVVACKIYKDKIEMASDSIAVKGWTKINNAHVKSMDQIRYNKMLYKASKKYNKPLIAGTDTHSIDSYKAECRSILQKAKHIEFSNEDEFDLTYKSYDELVDMFKQQGSLPMNVVLEAIENTNRMADSVTDYELDTAFKYPILYDNEEEVFVERIYRMYHEKLDKGIIQPDPRYEENIKEELRVFKKIGMVGFMLFMSELVCWCWDNGIPIGFCRGSVGGSTIAYLTDIIDVNPVVWNTVFSRFANEDRKEIGDIDLDIAPSQRHLVYEHIIEKFGADKTAYVLAIGTISDKGTIDEIGRALNMPLGDVKQVKAQYLETSADAIAEIEYYAGFNRDKTIEKINEACAIACDVMREHLRDVETMFSDKDYGFEKIVTYTTRPMRKNETQDVTYHFISEDDFKKKIEEKFFTEYKTYNTANGVWYYGSKLTDSNEKSVVILTPSGYKDYIASEGNKNDVSIYIYANNNTIRTRLKKRGDKKEEAERRILADNEDFKDTISIVDRIVYNNEGANIDDVVKKVYEEYCKTLEKNVKNQIA